MAGTETSAAATSGSAGGEAGTRYARVIAILDAAAAGSVADYGGQPRFWAGGVERLAAAVISGVRMIAPAVPAACCAGEADDGYSRATASGLIRGLKGEAPFGSAHLPRLPWGGRPVAAADIAFIADWIDDGLPSGDRLQAIELGPLAAEADGQRRLIVTSEHEFALDHSPRAARPGEPRRRQNIDEMEETEKTALRAAFRAILDLDHWPEDRRSYNNQALIHQNHCQHGWERFLPWHRAYLYEFEQNFLDLGHPVALPYWDWTMPRYLPGTPPDPTKGDIIPQALKAYLLPEPAEAMIARLRPQPSADQKARFMRMAEPGGPRFTRLSDFYDYVRGTVGYTDFAVTEGDPNRQAMIDALLDANALWYPLRYPAQYKKGTIERQVHYHYPTADDMRQIMAINNFRDFGGGSIYDAAFGFLDQNPHNTMHIWTGGMNPDSVDPAADAAPAMTADRRNTAVKAGGRRFHSRSDLYSLPQYGDMFSNLTASYDQIFWPIHANVDRVWSEWQKSNPNAVPADTDSILSPWNYTVGDMLDMSRFGYEYVRKSSFIRVGTEATVGRFVSAAIPISQGTRAFKRAEVRLHAVPQLLRSCFVRVFLNQPGADASTPTHGNPHYAGYLAIFGHGTCYGGPGHCDIPPPVPRVFDLRTRSHNMPRNHRVDVTEVARRLLAGATELRVTLVVIGGDYQEDRDVLRLDGVSLNFFD